MDERTLKVLEYYKIIEMLEKFAKSKPGKELVKALRPTADKDKVLGQLEETKEAESIIAIEGTSFVSYFSDISFELKKAELGSILSPKDLLKIGQVLSIITSVKKRMKEYKGKQDLRIIPSMVEGLKSQPVLLKYIESSIESEESIFDNASPSLANIRRLIARANDRIRERLNGFLHSSQMQKYLQEPIITIRNNRYVIPVKQEHRASVPGIVHDQSSSGATLFIEPMSVVEANNEARQLMLKEEEEIQRILADLTQKTADLADEIKDSLDILIRLDFIFAKGAFSLAMNCSCPKIADDLSLRIVKGRHPLIDENEVVPISLDLANDCSTLVITGPNTGGKTVTLKTVGLFVLMAQSGLNLPAAYGTSLGIYNNVFADIGDEQSIEQSLSTFSSHMTNIVRILKQAETGDLVLFDELGAGTDPTEGAALAMSILDYLRDRGIKAMATTHYSELKVYAITNTGVINASMEFDVETLRPTFRLLIGVPGKSNAFEISKRLGLDDRLIDGAKKYLSQEDIRFEDVLRKIDTDRVIAEEERDKAQAYLAEIEDLKNKHQDLLDKLEQRRDKIVSESKQEARRILKEAKESADLIIEEIRRTAQINDKRERNKAIEQARKDLKELVDGLEERPDDKRLKGGKPPKRLKAGDTVYITSLDQKGQVIGEADSSGNLTLQVGIMKVNAHISDLRLVKEEKPIVKKTSRELRLRTASISSELDLRGQNAEDALLNTDMYLDEAFLAGLKEVTIIHGKGTGILRTSIQQMLRKHPHVDSFRLGKYGEGESGVTVVVLK
ncbi:MAG: endonuclease MutS2 [Eubacteriales bacterium]|jgi:DNA mismatch repair protein MutS2|nr:endonuclease MutS2 [Clostridia bacterium]MDI9511734.1 endonuclease MutS2 [Bacillota bacterium]